MRKFRVIRNKYGNYELKGKFRFWPFWFRLYNQGLLFYIPTSNLEEAKQRGENWQRGKGIAYESDYK